MRTCTLTLVSLLALTTACEDRRVEVREAIMAGRLSEYRADFLAAYRDGKAGAQGDTL